MANTILHFEIPADDVARAKLFYEKTFGWKIKLFPLPPGSDPYYGITAKKPGEDGINGGLMPRKMAGQPFTNYVTVKSIDAMNEVVVANGGTVVLPKQEIGMGMGWISAFTDPENNLIGLHQMPPPPPKPAAKKAAPKAKAKAKAAAKKAKPAKKAAKKAKKKKR